MSTEIAVETKPAPRPPVTTGGKVAAFVPNTMDEAWRLSQALAASGMIPKAYGNDANKVMVGIMAGAEVGFTPFAALQSIAVIGNNPSIWGDGALALVQSSGLLEDMEETDDGNIATCRVVRVGRSTPIVRTFSMEDAKRAGLSGKSGPWTQYPARMRQMRARAFALRDGFPDVLKGLHVAEEVRDYAPARGMPEFGDAQPLSGAMLLEQAKGGDGQPEAVEAEVIEPDQAQADEMQDQNNSEQDAGEQPSDEPQDDLSPAEAKLAEVRARIAEAKTIDECKVVDTEWLNHRAAYDDDTAAAVDKEIAARRVAIRGGAA